MLATIKAYGIYDVSSRDKWSRTNIHNLSCNTEQTLILQHSGNSADARKLIKDYEANVVQRRKETIINNSKKFAALDNSQKLKQYKNHWNKLKIMEDEPFLMHNNIITPKNDALQCHYENICGPITDPTPTENPLTQDINDYYDTVKLPCDEYITFFPNKPEEKQILSDENMPPINLTNEEIDEITWDENEMLRNFDISGYCEFDISADSDSPHNEEEKMNELPDCDTPKDNTHSYHETVEFALRFTRKNGAPGYDLLNQSL